VVAKFGDLRVGLEIPEGARKITRARDDVLVVEEPTAGEVARVGEFSEDAILGLSQVVDGAGVVETAACYKIATWGVGAGHDPGRSHGDDTLLVGREGVPHEQLSVLRCRNDVPLVARPMHGVDFVQMALQLPPLLHYAAGKRLHIFCEVAHCVGEGVALAEEEQQTRKEEEGWREDGENVRETSLFDALLRLLFIEAAEDEA